LPTDNEARTAAAIYRANLVMIAAADALIADLNPFRGCEPDSGTCFEIGYAVALGKPVVAFLADPRSCLDKVTEARGNGIRRKGRPSDGDGLYIEDFGLPANLMLGISCHIVGGGLREALAALAEHAATPTSPTI
jgi:nucleoside 2-deoxyribosyltransferase